MTPSRFGSVLHTICLLDKGISLSVCYNTDLGVAWLMVYCAEFGRYQYCQYQDTAAILQIHVLCSMYWYGAGTGGLEYGSCADWASYRGLL